MRLTRHEWICIFVGAFDLRDQIGFYAFMVHSFSTLSQDLLLFSLSLMRWGSSLRGRNRIQSECCSKWDYGMSFLSCVIPPKKPK